MGSVSCQESIVEYAVFASLAWTAGTRPWTEADLQGIRILQVRVTWRLGECWPRVAETWPDYARRTSRWAEDTWKVGSVRSFSLSVGRLVSQRMALTSAPY